MLNKRQQSAVVICAICTSLISLVFKPVNQFFIKQTNQLIFFMIKKTFAEVYQVSVLIFNKNLFQPLPRLFWQKHISTLTESLYFNQLFRPLAGVAVLVFTKSLSYFFNKNLYQPLPRLFSTPTRVEFLPSLYLSLYQDYFNQLF